MFCAYESMFNVFVSHKTSVCHCNKYPIKISRNTHFPFDVLVAVNLRKWLETRAMARHTFIKNVFRFVSILSTSIHFYIVIFFSCTFNGGKKREQSTNKLWIMNVYGSLLVNLKWLLQLQMFIQLMVIQLQQKHSISLYTYLMLLESRCAFERCSIDTRFIVPLIH